ncbi:MAG: hypothetical protein VB076_01970, partial [Synergistaceae bacterium]|nr:hypothetical protein [Synergistaceae bacterium]
MTEAKHPSSSGNLKNRQNWIHEIILTVLVVLIIAFYLRFSWDRYNEIASSEAIMLAESAESILHPQHIAELSGKEEDITKPEYIMTKLSLS